MVKVFVYGTLKPGEANYKTYCADKVVDAHRAYALGKLFALPMGYPAMTLGDSLVYGYLLFFTDLGVLSELDELEGYQHTRAASENLYYRQQIKIYDPQGRRGGAEPISQKSLGFAWSYLMTPKQIYQLRGILQSDGWWSGCGLTAEQSYDL